MKNIVTIPIVLVIVLISSSCGSSSKEEPVIYRPLPAPPTLSTPSVSDEQPVAFDQTAIPVKSAIPVASRVAGRPGFVFNPYNQNMVEVNGLASGTKCRDPQDPDPSHVFVVP